MNAPENAARVVRDARGLMPYATSLIAIAPDPDRADGVVGAAFNRGGNGNGPCAAQIAALLRDLADQYQATHDNDGCGHETSGGGL